MAVAAASVGASPALSLDASCPTAGSPGERPVSAGWSWSTTSAANASTQLDWPQSLKVCKDAAGCKWTAVVASSALMPAPRKNAKADACEERYATTMGTQ